MGSFTMPPPPGPPTGLPQPGSPPPSPPPQSQQQPPPAPPPPPYAPTTASLGGIPLIHLDIPLAAVFIFLYLIGIVINFGIFIRNKRRGYKFLMSAMLGGFCIVRIVTLVLRITWACYAENVKLAIAASIFVQIGVIILIIINLIFNQRIVRATHPHVGWHKAFSAFFQVLFALIPAVLVVLVIVNVLQYYTLDPHTIEIEHDIALGAQCYILFLAFITIPIVITTLVVPRRERRPVEKFGSGRWRTKVAILLFAATLITLGAAFRTAVSFTPTRPVENPAWYQNKICFWCFYFVIEIIVVYTYDFTRIDHRFYVPNKSGEAGGYNAAYAAQQSKAERAETSYSSDSERSYTSWLDDHWLSEDDAFDGKMPWDSDDENDKKSMNDFLKGREV